MRFEIVCSNAAARVSTLRLPHGELSTPAFMPVGTQGSVKALFHEDIEALHYRLILANTYHLFLRPGIEVIRRFGGLHGFIGWPHGILTDSGGYQIYSLASLCGWDAEGVRFRSHIDGSSHFLTPEGVVELQAGFGSDLLMPLDVCTPHGIDEAASADAVERTTDWARRSASVWRGLRERGCAGSLFGIVQGNFFPQLRRQSAEQLVECDLPGYAIGGLSVGEPFELFREMVEQTVALLPVDRPRYVMGIGTPQHLLAAVEAGVDLFDCVLPTRLGRHGSAMTRRGTIPLRNARHAEDDSPIDECCTCRVCRRHSLGYLRHLLISGEMLAPMLISYHNLFFMQELMGAIRTAIGEGRLRRFAAEFLAGYRQ